MSKKRTFTIVLAALMVAVLLVCVLAACDPKQKDPVPPGPEGGTYYFDAGTAEYTVTLEADSKFTLDILGETRIGTYSLSGSALLLTFDDGSEPLSAKLMNSYNNLELTYNGQTFIFLRKTEYTVTFVTGEGATQLDPVQVVNGKTLSKPEAPSKDGNFVFEGWYSDSEFQNKYDFDAPVTGDITLYANFVSSIREPIEFTVKFAGDGVFEPIQTIKGVAYGLPEPKRNGDKFVGWWVSSSNEQGKLSYKYEGQKLTENTTFFPMWKSQLVDGLEVSVSAEGVFWTGAGDVTISVVTPSEETQEFTGKNGSYKFGADTFAFSENGEYSVTVKAAGSEKTTMRYFVNGRLSRVSYFEVENNSLKFNHVANAQSYNVTAVTKDGVKIETLDASAVQNSTMVFDFSTYNIPTDGYEFTVEATADDYIDSTSDTFKFNRYLDKVAEPQLNDAEQSYSWQTVANATHYKVTVNGEEVADGNLTSLDLKEKDPATYSITVQPFGFGYNSPGATTFTFNKTKLAVPKVTAGADGKTINWNSITGNSGYTVYNGDTVLAETTTNSYNIDQNKVGSATIELSVVTKSSNAQNNSPRSDALRIANKLESVAYENGVISWNLVYGAAKYYVKINDGQEYEVVGTSTSDLPLVAKSNVISVRPENGESKSLTVEAYEIAFNLSYEGGSMGSYFKTADDSLELPAPTERTGYDFNYWMDGNGKEIFSGKFNFANDVTFFANWTAHVFDVQFDFQNLATDEEANASKYQGQMVTYDSTGFTFPVPETASKDNKYAFEGWYLGTSSNSQKITDHFGNSVGSFTFEPSDGTVMLYANWVEIFKFEEAGEGWRVSKNGANIDYLSEVTIPAQQDGKWVVAISDFSGCTNLKTLNIPSSISQINFADQGVSFAGDTALRAINVYNAEGYNDVAKYSAKDGVLFENDAQGNAVKLVFYPIGKIGELTEYTVPSGTKTVASGAFYTGTHIYNFFKLNKVNFSATVEKIERNAFYNIDSITELNFLPVQDGETEASGLSIEPLAFNGENYYSTARDITTLTLPRRFNDDSFDVFLDFEWLDNIFVEEGGEFESIDGVLCKKIEDSTSLELVFFPRGRYNNQRTSSYVIPTNVTKIGAKAFFNYSDLKEITIGAHVTDIGESAFEGCNRLTSITFLGTKESSDLHIGKRAFYAQYSGTESIVPFHNSSIKELTLPANLVSLGAMAFARYYNLTTVNVNVDREEVDFEDNAFVDVGLSNGAHVTDVNIGAGVPAFSIAAVFGGALTKVNVAQGNNYYANDGTGNGVLYNSDITSIVFFPKTYSGAYSVPDEMTEISSSLFAGCTGITSITLHNGVTSIGDFAFSGCTGLQEVNFGTEPYEGLTIGTQAFASCTKLQNITLPEGLKTLGEKAFAKCSTLNNVSLPVSLETIIFDVSEGFTLFDECAGLQSLTIAQGNKHYGTYDDILYGLRAVTVNGVEAYEEDDLLFCPHGKSGTVTIPGTVRNVQSVAFEGSNVQDIVFEDLTKTENVGETEDTADLTIHEGAFYNTPLLKRIHFPEGMTTLDVPLFYVYLSGLKNEYAFTTLEIPSTLETLGANLFEDVTLSASNKLNIVFAEAGNKEVGGLTIAGGATSSAGLFNGLNVETIKFPSQLIKLGDRTFYSNKNIKSVEFTPSAKNADGSYIYNLEIGTYVFYETNLDQITLPENLAKIGNYAFYNCAFSSVSIPANVTEIGSSAFGGGSGYVARHALEWVTFDAGSKLESIGDSAFNGQSLVAIQFPATLKSIGKGAFSAIKTLKQVTFAETPAGQTPVGLTIDNNAFAGDNLLTEFKVPARTVSIGSQVFNNSGLASIEFENGSEDLEADNTSMLENIGDSAFAYTKIANITLPKTAKELKLGASLFVGCSKLTEITISSTVLDISNVFTGLAAVEHINVAEANPKFVAEDHGLPIIYEQDEQMMSKSIVLIYADVDANLTLTGTRIGAGALANITSIKHITIGKSIVEIGEKAFENCVSLETVTIEPDSSLQTVGAFAFLNCTSLTDVDFSNAAHLTTFGDGTVKNTSTSASASNIAGNVGIFNGCTSLQKVTLGSGVTKLGTAMFAGSSVVTVDMSRATQLEELSEGAFANTPNLREVILPAAEQNKIVHLGRYTFYGSGVQELDFSSCTQLKYTAYSKEIALDPTADKTINGTSAYAATFAFATALTSVKLPTSMLGLGPYTFRGCTSLTTVTGIENVTDFYDYCFAETGDLTLNLGNVDTTFYRYEFYKAGNVKINANLSRTMTFDAQYIFQNAKIREWTIRTWDVYTDETKNMFENCTELETVKVQTTPIVADDVFTNIYGSMFKGCTKLTSFDFSKLAHLQTIGSSAFSTLEGELDLSTTSITTLDTSAFTGCKITSVKLPASLESIGNSAFKDCGELESVDFTLCTKLDTIGTQAFMNCKKLQKVDLTTTIVSELKSEVFSTCSKLESVKLPATIAALAAKVFQKCEALQELDLSHTSVTRFSTGGSTAVTTSISAYTFDGCTKLKTVKVNNSFSEIGGYAFRKCTNFTGLLNSTSEIVTTITKVGQYAFQDCTSLLSFDLTNVELFGQYAFSNTGLSEVTLPERQFAVSSNIGTYVFKGNKKLKTVTIPAGFSVGSKIGNYMFQDCTALTTINFLEDANATERLFPLYMFKGCTLLDSVDMTNAYISVIPQEMFSGDKKLTQVTLSDMVTEIGQSAFSGCTTLATINLRNVVTIGTSAFKDCALTAVEFEKLETLAEDAFVGNSKLTSFTLVAGSVANDNFYASETQFSTKDGSTVYMYIFNDIPDDGVLDLAKKGNVTLSAYMFQGVTGLKQVILPSTITEIPDHTFAGSTITTMDLSSLTSLESIGVGAFADTKLSDFKWAPSVKTIGAQAFCNTQLASIEIPATVTSIGQGAFANCTKLTSVTLADGEEELTIDDAKDYPTSTSAVANVGVFENDPITTLVLGNRLKTIPSRAFANGKNVKFTGDNGYALSLSVEKVNDYAFYGSFVGSVVFSSDLTYIGAAAFANTAKLTSVTFSSSAADVQFKMNGKGTASDAEGSSYNTAQYFGVFEASALSSVVGMPKFVNEKTQESEIGSRMFKDCANLKSLTLNSTSVAAYAFENTPLEQADLTGMTVIGDRAFYNTKLTTLNIPATVTSIGTGAFASTPLTTVVFAEGSNFIKISNGKNGVPDLDKTTLKYKLDTLKFTDYGVFGNCLQLQNVTLSNRVNTIGSSMFVGCEKLTAIELPVVEGGVTINSAAFTGSGLTSIDLTKATTLKSQAFAGAALTSLEVPINLTFDSYEIFAHNDGLTEVTFINPTGEIYPTSQNFNQLLEGCQNLQKVTICEGVTALNMTVIDCPKVNQVILPESLTTIQGRTFENCTSLKKLVLPKGLTSIVATAFDGCSEDMQLCFQVSKTVAYAMTYTAGKTPSTPLPEIEASVHVVYNYDPQAEAEDQPAPSPDTHALMQTAMGNVAYVESEH